MAAAPHGAAASVHHETDQEAVMSHHRKRPSVIRNAESPLFLSHQVKAPPPTQMYVWRC